MDWRKHPEVVKEIDSRLADLRKLWSIDRDKSLAAFFKIQQEAKKKGNWGVVTKCEELCAKLAGLFIERIQTMNINKEISDEDLNANAYFSNIHLVSFLERKSVNKALR